MIRVYPFGSMAYFCEDNYCSDAAHQQTTNPNGRADGNEDERRKGEVEDSNTLLALIPLSRQVSNAMDGVSGQQRRRKTEYISSRCWMPSGSSYPP